MILNVSGRTDVVAFYSKWFLNRYKEGFVDVRNPFNEKLVSRIFFDDVDLIVFCTKNPIPILNHLKEIKKPIVFHVTLTPYEKDIEPNVPSKGMIINAIKKLSEIVGIDNLYIRYDPVFINKKYNIDYHIKTFDDLCKRLDGYVRNIIISFIDYYKNVERNMKVLDYRELTYEEYEKIGINFAKSAKEHNMTVQTCAEKYNLVEYGFKKSDCITEEMVKKITGKTNKKKWKARKNKNCNCVEMVDIGIYNACKHFCKYCYANYDEKKVENNCLRHNPDSSLLIGSITESDTIKIRKE